MHVCITDFGFADLAEPTTTAGLTPETARGVSWYSAPELLDEDAQPNYASDVWSFGCVSLLVSVFECVATWSPKSSADMRFLTPFILWIDLDWRRPL